MPKLTPNSVRGRLVALLCIAAAAVAGCGGSSNSSTPAPPPPSPPPPPPPPSPTLGLDARPSNASCVAPPRQVASVDIELERQFGGLSLSQPLAMLQAPGDSTRWFVVEKPGRVRVFSSDPATTAFEPNFIDSIPNLNDSSEGGLLGMAFHPDYQNNGQVFLSWTEGSPMTSVIARFEVNPGGQTLNAASRTDILRLEQDFSNHNGGQIEFGPDGYLYIG
ncbi:MAG: PQQ-dependent sugar dehydrogenase, partial [Gammaproteobacteria bacterium]|nr:PQQ-dependent sugar dehydrogenase [Gammaproteobacteria bacterium]